MTVYNRYPQKEQFTHTHSHTIQTHYNGNREPSGCIHFVMSQPGRLIHLLLSHIFTISCHVFILLFADFTNAFEK